MVFSLWTANARTYVGGFEEKPWILLPLLSRGSPRHAQHQDLWSISLCTQGHSADQLPREALHTAEMHHLLREHRAFQLLGTRSAEGSSVEGGLRAHLILGLHKISPFPQESYGGASV